MRDGVGNEARRRGVTLAVTWAAYAVRSVPLRRLAVLGPVGRGAGTARRGQGGHDRGSLAGVVGGWQGRPRRHWVLLRGPPKGAMPGGSGQRHRGAVMTHSACRWRCRADPCWEMTQALPSILRHMPEQMTQEVQVMKAGLVSGLIHHCRFFRTDFLRSTNDLVQNPQLFYSVYVYLLNDQN